MLHHTGWEALSAFFHIHKLTDVHAWLVWLTGQRQYAPPSQTGQLTCHGWLWHCSDLNSRSPKMYDVKPKTLNVWNFPKLKNWIPEFLLMMSQQPNNQELYFEHQNSPGARCSLSLLHYFLPFLFSFYLLILHFALFPSMQFSLTILPRFLSNFFCHLHFSSLPPFWSDFSSPNLSFYLFFIWAPFPSFSAPHKNCSWVSLLSSIFGDCAGSDDVGSGSQLLFFTRVRFDTMRHNFSGDLKSFTMKHNKFSVYPAGWSEH